MRADTAANPSSALLASRRIGAHRKFGVKRLSPRAPVGCAGATGEFCCARAASGSSSSNRITASRFRMFHSV